jgi:quercetin dioxygenase-like cupin family protein
MSGESLNGSAAPAPPPPSGEVAVIDAGGGPEVPLVASGGTAHAVIHPGMGAKLRTMYRISLEAEGRTERLQHPSEAVYYVIAGGGSADEGEGSEAQKLVEGSMVHVEPGTPYVLRAGVEGMELVGGPSPADPALDSSPEEA